MISSPQGNVKHTGHVGLDGAYFGDISFLDPAGCVSIIISVILVVLAVHQVMRFSCGKEYITFGQDSSAIMHTFATFCKALTRIKNKARVAW